MQRILDEGVAKGDRTGTGTRSMFGHQMRFDLAEGFPLVTTKKMHLKSIIYELLWFLRGETNVALSQRTWRDDLGRVGRCSKASSARLRLPVALLAGRHGETIDQISDVIEQIRTNPDSRRLIVSAWNVAELPRDGAAAVSFAVSVLRGRGRLSCQMYQRSADVFLGVPFNIASYALLTMMVAQVTGLSRRVHPHARRRPPLRQPSRTGPAATLARAAAAADDADRSDGAIDLRFRVRAFPAGELSPTHRAPMHVRPRIHACLAVRTCPTEYAAWMRNCIDLIVAVAENGIMAADGHDLPWRLSADLRRFKRLTMGHTISWAGGRGNRSAGRCRGGERSSSRDSRLPYRAAKWSMAGESRRSAGDRRQRPATTKRSSSAARNCIASALPRAEPTVSHARLADGRGRHGSPGRWNDWQLVESEEHAPTRRTNTLSAFETYDRTLKNVAIGARAAAN